MQRSTQRAAVQRVLVHLLQIQQEIMHTHQQLAPQLLALPLLLQRLSRAVPALPHQLLLQRLSRARPGVPPLRPPATMPTNLWVPQLPSTQLEAAHLPANLMLRKQGLHTHQQPESALLLLVLAEGPHPAHPPQADPLQSLYQGAETNGGCTPMLPSMSGCSVPLLWALVHITIMPRMACRQGGTSISPTLGMVESLGPQIQESLIQNSWMIQKANPFL